MTHMNVSLAEALAEELSHLVPRRRRSAFVAAAIAEKLARERQARAVAETAGAWSNQDRDDPDADLRALREGWSERSLARE
jgi:hypothetical protein